MSNAVHAVSSENLLSPHTLKFCCRPVTGDDMYAGSSTCEVGPTCPGVHLSFAYSIWLLVAGLTMQP